MQKKRGGVFQEKKWPQKWAFLLFKTPQSDLKLDECTN
jgi:hypothetical protein